MDSPTCSEAFHCKSGPWLPTQMADCHQAWTATPATSETKTPAPQTQKAKAGPSGTRPWLDSPLPAQQVKPPLRDPTQPPTTPESGVFPKGHGGLPIRIHYGSHHRRQDADFQENICPTAQTEAQPRQRQATANRPASAAHPQHLCQGPRVEQHHRLILPASPPTEQRLSLEGKHVHIGQHRRNPNRRQVPVTNIHRYRQQRRTTVENHRPRRSQRILNHEDRNVLNGRLQNPHRLPAPEGTSGRPRRSIHDLRRPSRTQ